MVRWQEDEAQLSRQRHASAVGGAQGNGRRGGLQEEWKETRAREHEEGGEQEE